MGVRRKVITTIEASCDKCSKLEQFAIPGTIAEGDARLPSGWAYINVRGMPPPIIMQMQEALEGNIPAPEVGHDVQSMLDSWDDSDDEPSKPPVLRRVPCVRMLCGDCVEKLWECVGLPKPMDMEDVGPQRAKQAPARPGVLLAGGMGGITHNPYALARGPNQSQK